MFNDKTYNLLMKILDSSIREDAKTEIVKFYLLPRNTSVRPMVELPDEEALSQVGSIKRPDPEQLKRRQDPAYAQEIDAMAQTLSKHVPEE